MTEQTGVSRRSFLKGAGVAAVAGALGGASIESVTSKEGQLQTPIVTGFIFEDTGRSNNPNGNVAGVYEGWTAAGSGEPKAQGVKVQLLKLQGGENSASVVIAETETNEKGTYFFAGVEPGRYRVDIDQATFVQGDQEFDIKKDDTVVFASMFGIDSVNSFTK